jgi:hypothetical protein
MNLICSDTGKAARAACPNILEIYGAKNLALLQNQHKPRIGKLIHFMKVSMNKI